MTISQRGPSGRFLGWLVSGLAVMSVLTAQSQSGDDRVRPRVIVTTDPELDDSNSLVRYLLYAADFQTEGLIYASSQFHWKGDGQGTLFSVPNREYSRGGLNLCPSRPGDGSRASATSTMRSTCTHRSIPI
jgi:hypothetical protein